MKARRHTVIRFGTATCLVTGLLAAAGASAQQGPGGWNAEPPVSPALSRDADIFGWQLMTHQERSAYRERMRAAISDEEREELRAEHQAAMQVRARARGVALPAPVRDAAPARSALGSASRPGGGAGAGPGGAGSGAGAGAGAGGAGSGAGAGAGAGGGGGGGGR